MPYGLKHLETSLLVLCSNFSGDIIANGNLNEALFCLHLVACLLAINSVEMMTRKPFDERDVPRLSALLLQDLYK